MCESKFKNADGSTKWSDLLDALLEYAADFGRDWLWKADLPPHGIEPSEFPRVLKALEFVAPDISRRSWEKHWDWVRESVAPLPWEAHDDEAEFYDRLAQLDDAAYWRRIDQIAELVGSSVVGPHPEYDVDLSRRTKPATKARTPIFWPKTDSLTEIEPAVYVAAIAQVEVAGKTIRCPLHEERTPSFRVWPDPEGGWYCYGCSRGGTIYEFAAHFWDLSVPLRGDAFREVNHRLKEMFGVRD